VGSTELEVIGLSVQTGICELRKTRFAPHPILRAHTPERNGNQPAQAFPEEGASGLSYIEVSLCECSDLRHWYSPHDAIDQTLFLRIFQGITIRFQEVREGFEMRSHPGDVILQVFDYNIILLSLGMDRGMVNCGVG